MEVSDGSGFNEPVLNEVLSLNAQEWREQEERNLLRPSSMKS